MIHKIYAVRDQKVEAFMQPIFLPTLGAATRAMTDLVNDPGHTFNRHTEDFVLFDLGEFDDSVATFELHASPIAIGNLVEFKKGNSQ